MDESVQKEFVKKGSKKGKDSVKGQIDLTGIWFDTPPNRRMAAGAQIIVTHDPKAGTFSYKFKKHHDFLHYIGEVNGNVSGNSISGKMRYIHPHCPSIMVPWRAEVLKTAMGDGIHVQRIAWDIPDVRPSGRSECDFAPSKGWSGHTRSWFRPSACKYVQIFKHRDDVPNLLEKLRGDLARSGRRICE
ncbi:hypothetical protein [Solemya velum gill symbiont]|uniref:hypothetical protein n=1 Tax=Solemya velum gill symbiont TaxID=2340 RepID=UPI0011819003|nr:hypothetical protein [Solemya velum gill symbiont]